MSRGIVAAGAAMLTTGCFEIPPYTAANLLSYTAESDGGGIVTGPNFSLHFAGGAGFHFPDALTIDGTNVMGQASNPACDAEDGAGFQFSPTPRISANSGMPTTNRLMPTLDGPAAVQVELDWASQYACAEGTTVLPNGTSTFTVFPDGRIVRDDMLVDPTVPNSPLPSFGGCNCGDLDPLIMGFTVSSYWTIAQAPFQKLYTPDTSDTPAPHMLPFTDRLTGQSIACMANDKYQVGLVLRSSDLTTIQGDGTLIGFGRQIAINDSRLDMFPWENSFTMFIERGDTNCTTALMRAKEYYVPPPPEMPQMSSISIDGDSKLFASAHDGIYGGLDGNGHTGIMLMADHVTLTGPVTSSFAVWLRFPHAVDTLRATRKPLANTQGGVWYVPQRLPDHSWIVWFRDGLPADQTITIESI